MQNIVGRGRLRKPDLITKETATRKIDNTLGMDVRNDERAQISYYRVEKGKDNFYVDIICYVTGCINPVGKLES